MVCRTLGAEIQGLMDIILKVSIVLDRLRAEWSHWFSDEGNQMSLECFWYH